MKDVSKTDSSELKQLRDHYVSLRETIEKNINFTLLEKKTLYEKIAPRLERIENLIIVLDRFA